MYIDTVVTKEIDLGLKHHPPSYTINTHTVKIEEIIAVKRCVKISFKLI